jgi:hypothetical protein
MSCSRPHLVVMIKYKEKKKKKNDLIVTLRLQDIGLPVHFVLAKVQKS